MVYGLKELIESNLVGEIGQGKSSAGRQTGHALFDNLVGYGVGVDLGEREPLTMSFSVEEFFKNLFQLLNYQSDIPF